MRIVQELSSIITPKRTKHISLIDFNLKDDSKLMQLYYGLRAGKFKSDQEAIIKIYGNVESKYKYSKLKYDLRKRLFNTLHLVKLDEKEVGEYRKVRLECQKIWTAVYFLIGFNALKSAIYLLKKHYPKMLEYEFTLMVLEGAKLFRQYYSTVDIDHKEIEKYDQSVNDHLQLYVAETNTEGYFHSIMSNFVESKSQQEAVAALADDYLNKIEKIYPPILSNGFIFRHKMIEIVKYMSLFNYEKTIEICEEAINILEERNVKYRTALMLINSQWISCSMQLKRYQEAANNCEKVIQEYVQNGSFNWFKCVELYFQNLIYSEEYLKAYQVYLDTVQHKNFSKLPSAFREEWKIYRAYLEFLTLAGLVTMDETSKVKSFRLTKFLNDTPKFSKDKGGFNVTILIAQLTILIAQAKYCKVIDRMEAIEKYVSRHLSSDYHYRTRYFIKIISMFYRAGFDPQLINWDKINDQKKKLSEIPLNIINPNYDVEVIRYEILVEQIAQLIQR